MTCGTVSESPLIWFLIALAVRFVVELLTDLWSYTHGLDGFYPLQSGSDDRFYYQTAQVIAQGGEVDLSALPNIYPLFLGWMFTFTGASLFLGKAVNLVAGALTVSIAVCIAKELSVHSKYSRRDLRHPANLAGLLVSFYPGHMFYSTQLLKDPILNLLGTLELYLAVLAFRRKWYRVPPIWLMWMAILLPLYLWRGYTVYALVAAVMLFWFISLRVGLLVKVLLSIAGVGTWGVLNYFLGHGWFALNSIFTFLNDLSRFRTEVYSIGGSAVGVTLDPSRPVQFIFGYMYSFLTVLLGPFPWQIHSFVHVIALPEAILMWVLFPAILKGLWGRRKNPLDRSHLLWLFSLLLTGEIALFSDNVGANTRLRLLSWTALFIYASVALGNNKKREVRNETFVSLQEGPNSVRLRSL